MNPFENQRPVQGIKHIIAVSSGKGGVGKSTVAAQLAVAMARTGAKTGLLDADVYGPSLPRIFGLLNQKPDIAEDTNKIKPHQRWGVKLMSIGFMIEENAAVVWRGPMLGKALQQFFHEVDWGELDYLFLDLPPGTGDVQLSIAQTVPMTSAIAVTTPQNVALMDVKRSIDMFARLQIPVLGVVENMAYFKPAGSDQTFSLFPKGELESYLDKERITKLAAIPFYPPLSVACEIGIPLAEQDPKAEVVAAFDQLAKLIREKHP